jgi:hypothetical protein
VHTRRHEKVENTTNTKALGKDLVAPEREITAKNPNPDVSIPRRGQSGSTTGARLAWLLSEFGQDEADGDYSCLPVFFGLPCALLPVR